MTGPREYTLHAWNAVQCCAAYGPRSEHFQEAVDRWERACELLLIAYRPEPGGEHLDKRKK